MRLGLGLLAIAIAILWLRRMAARPRRVGPGQAFFDFMTGAPRESVLVVGLLLLGCLAVAAHFLGGG